MANKLIILTILPLLFGNAKLVHDYHVTVVEINYKAENGSLNTALNVFIDDLEKAMEVKGIKGLSVDLEKEDPEYLEEVSAYLEDHFKLSTGDEGHLDLQFAGYEWEDHHGLWFYFESINVRDFDSLSISNSLFVDLFPSQENIHYVNKGDEKKTMKLNKNQMKGVVSFD